MALAANTRKVFKMLAVGAAQFAISACATDARHADAAAGPALWRVADEDTTIYLFGAADALPPDAEWRSDAVAAALDAADKIVLETDESEAAQARLGPIIQEIGFYRDGTTLSDVLSGEQKAEIAAVTQSFGAPLQALNALKPWLAAIQIGALNAQKQGYTTWTSGLAQLQSDAATAGKPIFYLEESRAVLLQTINALSRETHVRMLVTAARQTRDKPTQAAEVVPLYLAGDADALAERYHGDGQWADEVVYDVLLVKRNQAWAAAIEDMLGEETGVIFFAVGTGHVLGEDSLQSMLESANISVNRE